jgi:hypothetical protein
MIVEEREYQPPRSAIDLLLSEDTKARKKLEADLRKKLATRK